MKRYLIIITLLGTLSSCDNSKDDSSSVSEHKNKKIKFVNSSAERFGYKNTKSTEDNKSTQDNKKSYNQGGTSENQQFKYKIPSTWKEQSKTDTRVINLSFGENNEGQCYLTIFKGRAGGELANINRWRRQVGLTPINQEKINILPKKMLLNNKATFINIDSPSNNNKIVGLILISDTSSTFLKMTGSKNLVNKNLKEFEEFYSSIVFK